MTRPLRENVTQAISDLDDIKAAVEERGIEVGNVPTSEYGALIRSIESSSPSSQSEDLGYVISRVGGTSLEIPEVTVIGEYALYKTDFTEVSIPDGCTTIEQYAFSNMQNLTSIVIPESVTSIGARAFYYDLALGDIQIDGPATIGDYAFTTGTGRFVNSLVAPKVTAIGNYAFSEKKMNFETLSLPSVLTIGTRAFEAFSYEGKLKNLLLPVVKTIGELAFSGTNVEYVSIPSVETIGTKAFNWCKYLTRVEIGDKLKSIGSGAFINVAITEFTIPESVTTIAASPFQTSSLLTITYNAINATNANKNLGAPNVTSFIIGDKVTVIPQWLCAQTAIANIEIPEGVTSIGNSALRGCTSLISVNIPNSVETLGEYQFGGDSSLTSVTLGSGLKSIGNNAFELCTSLTELTIPENVTALGKYLCTNCTALTTVNYNAIEATNSHGSRILDATALTKLNIGPQVKSIIASLCYNCTSLQKVDIPATVETIGDHVFGSCSSLTTLIIRGERVAPLGGSNVFKNTPVASGTGYIYVPSAVLADYQSASYWITYSAQLRAIEDYPDICG